MTPYVKKQNELRTEIADLSNCYSVLRDHYLRNNSQGLLEAMEKVSERILAAEKQLDTAIGADDLDSSCPAISIKTSKRMKI